MSAHRTEDAHSIAQQGEMCNSFHAHPRVDTHRLKKNMSAQIRVKTFTTTYIKKQPHGCGSMPVPL